VEAWVDAAEAQHVRSTSLIGNLAMAAAVLALMTYTVWGMISHVRHGPEIIGQWAAQHALEVVDLALQPAGPPAMMFKPAGFSAIYRATFRDREGFTGGAWVRTSSSPWIPSRRRVDVRWDSDSQPVRRR
jgi:hypothetical protein